jgi:glucose-1-phosphate adenylyltransferase
MDGNLIILAGGISSRMKRPGTGVLDPRLAADADEKTKGMIGVGDGGRPFLDYVLYNARAAGFHDVVIVIGENDHSIRDYYGPADRGNVFHGMTLGYAVQPIPPDRSKPLGTADALMWGARSRPDWKGKWFTVCNSDNLYSVHAMKRLRESRADCTFPDYDRAALEFESERIAVFSIVSTDAHHRLREIVEKPDPDTVSRLVGPGGRAGVSMNIFSFAYDRVLPYLDRVPLHPVRKEKEIPSAVMMMVQDRPGSVMTFPIAEHVPDLTNRDDIMRVQEFLSREFQSFSWD